MSEQLISYETARAAKKAGYNEATTNFYGRTFPALDFRQLHTDIECFGGDFSSFAPSQSQLAKWLRGKQVDITVVTDWGKAGRTYGVGYSYVNSNNEVDIWFCKQDGLPAKFASYEDALEVGLLHSLNKLKKVAAAPTTTGEGKEVAGE